MTVTVTAPAKLNLTLDVLGRLPNGYHEIKSVMQAVDLSDTVVLRNTTESGIALTIEGADLTPDRKNTAWKAAEAFLTHIGRPDFGVHITLQKQVPMQAGMAGGSADAAGVLVGLNVLTGTALSQDVLCALGAKVGADVPFCLVGGTKLAVGTGTELLPSPPMPEAYIVVVKPPVNVSTAVAYAAIDRARDLCPPNHEEMAAALKAGDLPRVGALLSNVFEQALDLPQVARLREHMLSFSPLGCRMTGSGSVVFALFQEEEQARRCAAALRGEYTEVFLCRPRRGGAEVKEILP